MLDRTALVISNIAFVGASAAHTGWVSAVYMLMAIVSTVYHVYQSDPGCSTEWNILRIMDHVMAWIVFAMNAYLLVKQWQRRPKMAAISTAAATAMIMFITNCDDYAVTHSRWHLAAGLSSALLAF